LKHLGFREFHIEWFAHTEHADLICPSRSPNISKSHPLKFFLYRDGQGCNV
jgi:hypothetical protein